MNYTTDNRTLIIFLLILMIIVIFFVLLIMHLNNGSTNTNLNNIERLPSQNKIQTKTKPEAEMILNNKTYAPMETISEFPIPPRYPNLNLPYQSVTTSSGIIQPYNPINGRDDLIRQYDYRKLYDPYENPVRRVARYEMMPLYLQQMVDLPTRGYPDNFRQLGILIKEGNPARNEDNKILRLYGRQEFPGSNRYEYYTAINSGNDQIKIPIRYRKQEIYDGDVVHIRELREHYRVQLLKYDAPRYYPSIF